MFVADDIEADVATHPQPEHHKTVPASHDTPTPAIGHDRPDNNGNQSSQRTGKVITHTE